MKVLLALRCDGDRDAFRQTVLSELSKLVERGGARRAALDLVVEGEEHESLQALDTEPGMTAVVSLWDPESRAAALDLALPPDAEVVGAYEVEEVVQREYERTWPADMASPGVKIVCFVNRRPDLTHEAYSAHWRERHGPLALAHQPGFWHYVQNHVVDRLTDTTPVFDGVGELHFRSAEEVHTGMFDSEEGSQLIFEDTERFMDHATSTTLPTNEYLVP
jgi:uncharacterized protein (TIGR02118 family)